MDRKLAQAKATQLNTELKKLATEMIGADDCQAAEINLALQVRDSMNKLVAKLAELNAVKK